MADFVTAADCNGLQWQAVSFPGNHLLVVAGPGTGKTHTLTCRAAYLWPRLPPDGAMAALTFTHKAAREMEGRLSARGIPADGRFFTGTFHQYCWQLLRDHAPQWRTFRIVDEDRARSLAADIWTNLTGKQVRERLEHISRWKAVEFADPLPPGHVRVLDEALRAQGWLDFDDVLAEAYRLLSGDRQVRAAVVSNLRHVFVDEYQDINPVQRAILKILVSAGGGLTAIGDPNQAIYGFRGSDVRFFHSFKDDFPGARVMTLRENYRSAANLLAASGQMMASSGNGAVPELTARIYREGNLVAHEAPTERSEAEYVVRAIETMVGGTSLFSLDSGRVDPSRGAEFGFGDIAVLYRLHSQARVLREALERGGIPCHVVEKIKAEDGEPDGGDAVCPPLAAPLEYPADKVMLMTIHAAKGLEFPAVFIAGCEDTLLPLRLPGLTSDEDEERRLFYVAMTRAKTRLFLLRAKKRVRFGRVMTNNVSPFVSDIEAALIELDRFGRRPKKRKTEEQLNLF